MQTVLVFAAFAAPGPTPDFSAFPNAPAVVVQQPAAPAVAAVPFQEYHTTLRTVAPSVAAASTSSPVGYLGATYTPARRVIRGGTNPVCMSG